jgi:hypothetical protein
MRKESRLPAGWLPPRLFFVVFVLVHSAVSVWLSLLTFSAGMARFESGASPTVKERLIEHASTVLLSPIFTLALRSHIATTLLPGLLGYLPVLANSALWAVVAWWLIRLIDHLRLKQRTAAD